MRMQFEHKKGLCLLLALVMILSLLPNRMIYAEADEQSTTHTPVEGVTISGVTAQVEDNNIFYYSGDALEITISSAVYQSYELISDDSEAHTLTEDEPFPLASGFYEFQLTTSGTNSTIINLKICVDNKEPEVEISAPEPISDEDLNGKQLTVTVTDDSPIQGLYYATTDLNTEKDDWMAAAKQMKIDNDNKGIIALEESEVPVTYYVYAVDLLGHVGENNKKLTVNDLDFTEPEVDVRFYHDCLVDEIENGTYYCYYNESAKLSDKILEILFNDQISGIEDLNLAGESSERSGLDFVIQKDESESQAGMKVGFNSEADAIYNFTIQAIDNAGNTVKRTITIIYDGTIPKISELTLHNAQESNDTYYTDCATDSKYEGKAYVSFEVTEANLDTISAKIGEENVDEDAICVSKLSGDSTYFCTFPLGDDFKNKSITVEATDKSGNNANKELFDGQPITYDTTAPVLTGFIISDGEDNEKEYDPSVADSWANNNGNTITLTLDEDNLIPDGLDEEDVIDSLLNQLAVTCNFDNGVRNSTIDLCNLLKTDMEYDADTGTVFIRNVSLPDGKYKFHVNVKDMAGNEMEEQIFNVQVDTKIPTLSVSRDAGNEYVPQGQTRQKSQCIHLKVQDSNVNKDGIFTWNLKVTDSNGADIQYISYRANDVVRNHVPISQLDKDLADSGNWKAAESQDAASESEDPAYIMDVTFLSEGNYTITDMYAYDDYNPSDSATFKEAFVIDGTAPVIESLSYSITDRKYSDYQLISKKNLSISVLVSDAISKIASVKIGYKEPGSEVEQEFTAKAVGNGQYTIVIPYNETAFKGTLTKITVQDSKGNVQQQTLGKGVVIDKESETFNFLNISIGDNTDRFAYDIYNKDVSLQLKAEDTYSGLDSVKYSINGVEQNVDFKEANSNLTYQWESEATELEANAENEGDSVEVVLEAEDNAGNTKTISKTYVIDVTKPVIQIRFDDENDRTFYDHKRVATITVTDKHLDTKDIVVQVTQDGKQSVIKPDFQSDAAGEVYTATVKFTEDADYNMTVECTDLAGNKAAKKSTGNFTVDKTKPKMQISFDNNSAVNGKYYSSVRTATITIEEHNFDASKVNFSIGASLDGSNISAPAVSSFTSKGDVHTAQIIFNKDGDYTLSGTMTDKAGNQSAEVSVDAFTIDQTVPEITIHGVDDGASYNDTVQPSIDITDVNFSGNDVNITLTGLRTGIKENITLSRNETAKNGVYRYEDFPHDIENDDYYILKASAHDMAGNLVEKTIEFKVNRFGSTYTLDSYTQAAVDKYYTNADNNFVIIEENVDEIVDAELYYSKDGDIVYLEKDKDFTVESSQGSDHWHTYRYVINTGNISQDGIYSFSLYSQDAVGNEMNNKSKNTILDICIDRTVPVCTISGVEQDGIYQEAERTVTIEAYDNISLDSVEVYLNGQKTEYKAEDIENDMITMIIPESNKKQELRVICSDMAGNVFDTADEGNISFTISTNALTTFMSKLANHIGLIIVICIVLAALLIFTIFLLLKRSKKEEQNV